VFLLHNETIICLTYMTVKLRDVWLRMLLLLQDNDSSHTANTTATFLKNIPGQQHIYQTHTPHLAPWTSPYPPQSLKDCLQYLKSVSPYGTLNTYKQERVTDAQKEWNPCFQTDKKKGTLHRMRSWRQWKICKCWNENIIARYPCLKTLTVTKRII
jgi:hypothetical protein